MVDRTPRSVTLPAYAWPAVLAAVRAAANRAWRRSRDRPPPPGSTADLDGLRARTLEEAADAIATTYQEGR
jgi:hypothetical protein